MARWRNDEWGRNDEAYQEPVDISEVEPIIEYEEPEIPRSVVRVDRDPLVVWAEKTGLSVEFWQSLGVRSEGDKYISFNYSEGWKKMRDVTLKLDVQTNKIDPTTGRAKVRRRFWWSTQPPNTVKPLWPEASEGVHEEIWFAEGESDCAVLRFLGFDAYTFGAATNIPGDVELRILDLMGVRRAILVFDADAPGRKAAEKMSAVLAEQNEIDVLSIDLGKILKRWKYVKDIRDIYNRLPQDDVRKLLLKARERILEERETDIAASIVAERAQTPSWIWDGLIAKGALNLLFGAAKMGKTTLTFHLIQAASGNEETHLLNRKVMPQRVLYYSEMPPSFDKQAMEAVCGGPPKNLWMRHSQDHVFDGMTWPGVVGQLERDIDKYNIEYVVIDTVIEWFKFQSEEMYDAAIVGEKLRLLRRITAKGVTVQINHHPPKSGNTPFGSIAFQGYVDCLVEMERDESGTTLLAKGRLRSDFSSVKYAYSDLVGKGFTVLNTNDKGDRESDAVIAGIKSRALALLPYSPGGLTLEELRALDESLAKSGRQLPTRLQELIKADMVGILEESNPPKYYRKYEIKVEKVHDSAT